MPSSQQYNVIFGLAEALVQIGMSEKQLSKEINRGIKTVRRAVRKQQVTLVTSIRINAFFAAHPMSRLSGINLSDQLIYAEVCELSEHENLFGLPDDFFREEHWNDPYLKYRVFHWNEPIDDNNALDKISVSNQDIEQFRPHLNGMEVQKVRSLISQARQVAEGIEDQSQRAIAFSYLNSAEGIVESPAPSKQLIVAILTLLVGLVPAYEAFLNIISDINN